MSGGRRSVQESKAKTALDSQPKQRPKSVDEMSGDDLKEYALSVGVSKRDVDGLTEDRLRQNCKVVIAQTYEDD